MSVPNTAYEVANELLAHHLGTTSTYRLYMTPDGQVSNCVFTVPGDKRLPLHSVREAAEFLHAGPVTIKVGSNGIQSYSFEVNI